MQKLVCNICNKEVSVVKRAFLSPPVDFCQRCELLYLIPLKRFFNARIRDNDEILIISNDGCNTMRKKDLKSFDILYQNKTVEPFVERLRRDLNEFDLYMFSNESPPLNRPLDIICKKKKYGLAILVPIEHKRS